MAEEFCDACENVRLWSFVIQSYLGVHWPSDVLASFATGVAWLTGFITAMEIQRKFYTTGEKQTALTQRTELKIGMLVAIWIFYAVYFYISHPLTKGL